MEYFHGTMKPGLTQLTPHASPYANLSEPLVYLTTSRQLALHYIWDTKRLDVKMPMLNIREDGVLVFQEMFPRALEYFYKGVSGYVYRCVGDYALNSAAGVPTCATSRTAVPVTDSEYIEDVYDAIVSYAGSGMFIYERYEDLPQWRIYVIRGHIMGFIQRYRLLEDPACLRAGFVREKFPRYWQEAQVLDQHGLL